MKQQIMSNAFVLVSLLALTACPGKNDTNKNTVVTPQGRITSLSSAGTYCDINNGTIVCSAIDATTGQSCTSIAKNYNPADMTNFCQQVLQLRNENSYNYNRCNVDAALTRILSDSCASVVPLQNIGGQTDPNTGLPVQPGNGGIGNPGAPGNPGIPGGGLVDNNMKNFECSFEAQKSSSGHFFSSGASIPRTISMIMLDGRMAQTIDLRKKFLGIDIGHFGTISMRYRPAGLAGTADTIILQSQGMKVGSEKVNMSRSGYAGQPVTLQAETEGLMMTVTCRGTSQFAGIATGTGANLSCTGKSNTVGAFDERIDMQMPLSQVSAGQEIALSQSVSATVDANGSKITYTAVLDRDYGPTITASSSLKSPAKLMAADSLANIDVTCKLQ